MLLNIQKNGEETVSGGSVTGDGPDGHNVPVKNRFHVLQHSDADNATDEYTIDTNNYQNCCTNQPLLAMQVKKN